MKQLEEKIANILSPYVRAYGEGDMAGESWFKVEYTGEYHRKIVKVTSQVDMMNFAKGESKECSGESMEEVFSKVIVKIRDLFPNDFYFTFGHDQLERFDIDPKKVQLQVFAGDIYEAKRMVSNRHIDFTDVMVRHEAQKHRDTFGLIVYTLEDLQGKSLKLKRSNR